jgi:hypothetical protein
MGPIDFHIFGARNKHLAGKWFETEAHMKGGVASLLETINADVFYTGILALVPRQVSMVITT